ncbi:MAG: DUF2723 domain-containing protein [Planctomycetota bacterium]
MTTEKRFDRWDLLLALAVAVAALVVYLFTLARTITGEDSGEFISAAWTWGVCHPPGYPLYTLLGKLATVLFPFGSIAFRVNLLSAILGCLAAGALSLLVIRVTGSRLAAWAAGLALAVSLQFWSLSVVAEVYTLHALLLVIQLLLLASWSEAPRNGPLLLFAFFFGLSLTNHPTMVGLAPVYAVYVLLVDRSVVKKPVLILSMLALFLLGLSPYLLLLLRSRAGPFPNWGHLRTLSDLAGHVLRRQYAGVTTEEGRSVALLLGELGAVARYFAAQFTWLGAGLALAGFLLHLARGKPSRVFLWTAVALMSSVGVGVFTNFPPDRAHLSANYQFFLPLSVVMALWIGLAASAFARLCRARVWLCAAVLLFPLLPLVANWTSCDRSRYFLNEDLARNLSATLEPDAVLFSTNDPVDFSLFYAQTVLGERRDILFATPYGPDDFARELPPALDWDRAPRIENPAAHRAWSSAALEAIRRLGRPLYFASVDPQAESLPGWTLRPEGFLWRLCPEDDPSWLRRNEEVWRRIAFRNFDLDPCAVSVGIDVPRDLNADWIIAHVFFMKGMYLLGSGDLPGALANFSRLYEVGDGLRALQNNAGIALAERGLWPQAAVFFEKAAQADPRSMDTRVMLAHAMYRAGRVNDALVVFALIRQSPLAAARTLENVADFYAELGDDLLGQGRAPDAARAYREALAVCREVAARGGDGTIRRKAEELRRKLQD